MKKILSNKIIIVPLLLFSFYSEITGQIESRAAEDSFRKNGISVLFGYHFNWSQDLVYSSMIYSGSSASAIELNYERFSKNGIHRFGFAYDNIKVTSTPLLNSPIFGSKKNRRKSEATKINLYYGYAHGLKLNDKIKFHIGGLLETKIYLTDYYFGLSGDAGFLFANSIQPWLLGNYQLNTKNNLQVEVYFPLASYASRPDYSIVDNNEIQYEGSDVSYLYQKGEIVTLNKYQAIDFSLTIKRELSKATDLLVRYRLDYARHNEPQQIVVLKNNFDIGFLFKF